MQIDVTVQDANNILCEVTPPQPQIIVIDRGVEGNGIVSIVPVTISTFQYLRITYTNGTVQDVGPLTSTAYTATAPITIVGNTISLATVPIASGGTDATTAAGAIQNLLPSYTGNGNKRLGLNSGATALEWVLDGGGTVTSINASGGTTGLTFSGGPVTTSGTLTLSGTLAVANGGTGVTTSTGTGSVVLSTSPTLVTPVLGTPTSGNFSTGTFTWPTFNQNTTGTAANITATSNSTLTTLSALSLPGSQVSGNISGNAANVTGVVAIVNGGTGQTTANAAFNALAPSQTGNSGKYLTTDGTNTSWATNPLGTVTSVAASVPSFMTISGSPITTSGTLAFGLSGTALPTTSGGTGLTSFTANGVLYASSTSALTSGSALTFDGTNFATTGTVTSGGNIYSKGTAIFFGDGADNSASIYATGGPVKFYANASEGMRLTSTGLGIGTSSPSQKLAVSSANPTNGYVASLSNSQSSAGRTGTYLLFDAPLLADWKIGIPADVNAFSFYDVVAGSERMRLDSSGNLGLGVTPSAWSGGGLKALEIAASGNTLTANGSTTYLNTNAYYNGGWKYGYTGNATQYYQNSGAHYWLTAGSGTAGNAITFTQAMTLSAAGNLGIGETSPSNRLSVTGSTGTIASFTNGATADFSIICGSSITSLNAGGANILAFQTGGTERARIDSSGNLLVGTTTANGTLTVSRSGNGNKGFFTNTTDADFAINLSSGVSLLTPSTGILAFGTSNTERARITSTGVLDLATGAGAVGQIQFPASQVASSNVNTLDDYEEGSWTPNLTGNGGGSYTMGGSNGGRYIKIGKMVWATATLQWTGQTTAYSGNLWVAGLPFTSAGNRAIGSMGAVSYGLTFTSGYGEWVYLMDPGYTAVYIIQNSTTGSGYNHGPTVGTTGAVYALSIVYEASA